MDEEKKGEQNKQAAQPPITGSGKKPFEGNMASTGAKKDINTNEPETNKTNQPQTTEAMEVHHPHHLHHKKKWTEYILEFLMLFFAVFLGFLAENYREHQIEEERTGKHMHTMVENLKYDTTRYGTNLRRNVETAKGLDSFRYEIKQAIAGNVNSNKLYYFFWKYRGFNNPIINDAAISQLKSSGMIRMIKSDSLVNEIGDYYGRRATLLNNSYESIIRTRTTLFEVVKQVFSYQDFDEFIERETTFSATPNTFNETYFRNLLSRDPALQLLPTAQSNLEQLYTEIAIYQMALRSYNGFIRYNHEGANSLMKHIKEEYSFK